MSSYDYEGALEDIFDGRAARITLRINAHGNYRLSVFDEDDRLLTVANSPTLAQALEAIARAL